MPNRFLERCRIAVSISDSPDLAYRGLGERHLRDVMVEIARHLISEGGSLVYGGDLRQHGYTELLFEVAARYHKSSDGLPAFTNVLPWPSHVALAKEEFDKREQDLGEHARLVRLARDGSNLPREQAFPRTPPEDTDWAPALTAMRRRVTEQCQVRIVLGGVVEGYRGRMPGIAEEALLALQAEKPVYVLGGFGGCSGDICEEMKLVAPGHSQRRWTMREEFAGMNVKHLRNGLTEGENRTLASTGHTDELVVLILRGLRRVVGAGG